MTDVKSEIAPLKLRLAILSLQFERELQVAELWLRLVRATTLAEAAACRREMKRIRAAIYDTEAGPIYHVGTKQ